MTERDYYCVHRKKGFPFPSLFSAVCFRSSHVNFPLFFRLRSISFPRPPSVRLSLPSTESFSSLSSLYQRHYTTTTPLSTRERRFLRPLLLLLRRRRPTRPALIQRRRGRRAEGGGTPSPLSPTRLRQKRTRRRRKEAAAGWRERGRAEGEKKPPLPSSSSVLCSRPAASPTDVRKQPKGEEERKPSARTDREAEGEGAPSTRDGRGTDVAVVITRCAEKERGKHWRRKRSGTVCARAQQRVYMYTRSMCIHTQEDVPRRKKRGKVMRGGGGKGGGATTRGLLFPYYSSLLDPLRPS